MRVVALGEAALTAPALRSSEVTPTYASTGRSSARSMSGAAAAVSANRARLRPARAVVDLGLAVVGEQGREMRVRPHAEHRDIQCRILAQLLDELALVLRGGLGQHRIGLFGGGGGDLLGAAGIGRHRMDVRRRHAPAFHKRTVPASRACFALRSSSSAATKRSPPHHTCTRLQSTASFSGLAFIAANTRLPSVPPVTAISTRLRFGSASRSMMVSSVRAATASASTCGLGYTTVLRSVTFTPCIMVRRSVATAWA